MEGRTEKREYSFECPIDHGVITSDSETDLIEQVQKHAKGTHDMDLSERQIRAGMKEERKA